MSLPESHDQNPCCSSDCALSRREFLNAFGTVGAALLIGGCGPHEDEAKPPVSQSASSLPAVVAVKNPDGTLRIPGGGTLKAGVALPFTVPPDDAAGIVFAAQDGKLSALSARCTHNGCVVNWNAEGGTGHLHCPCHGSNFDATGKVLNGPAKAPLANYQVRAQGKDAIVTLA